MRYHTKRFLLLIVPLLAFIAGCKSEFYSESDFPKVDKVDSHMHMFGEKTYFAEAAGKDNFRLITINVDHASPESVNNQHRYGTDAVKKYPGTVFYSTTFFFDTTGWGTPAWSERVINGLKSSLNAGPVSVKIWKNIGMTVRDRTGKFIMVDDPGLDPVFDFIIRNNLPVTGHLGEPRNCWLPLNEMTVRGDSGYFAAHPQYHMFLHPEYPSYEDQIAARDNMLARHPDLVFIGCHLGSLEYDVDELAIRLDRFPNMAVDMSARICHLQYQAMKTRDKVRNFCIKYQDRLLYGTDVVDEGKEDPGKFYKRIHQTWLSDWEFFTSDKEMTVDDFNGKFRGLKLPASVVDRIYYGNAVKWYRLEEKK